MKFDAHRIKYVIAREGLIIISLLLGAAISIYIDSWKTGKIDSYVKNAEEVILVKKQKRPSLDDIYKQSMAPPPSQSEGEKATPIVDPFKQPKAQFPQSTPYKVTERTMNRDFPNYGPGVCFVMDEPDNTNIMARYDDKGNKLFTGFPWNIDFEKVMMFFLFLAYPAYLLIRFIVWSISTVRRPH